MEENQTPPAAPQPEASPAPAVIPQSPSRKVPEGYRRIQTTISEEAAKLLDDFANLHFDDDKALALQFIIPLVCSPTELQRLGANAKLYFHKINHKKELQERTFEAEDIARDKADRQIARDRRRKEREGKKLNVSRS